MRYNYIELVGYAGIYNGMGLNQIRIDFSKCKYNKIIIRGVNGSGKSTIMNAINPNPDGNDNFIPGQEARKTLSLINDGTEYIIRYIHAVTSSGNRSTTKGYISKNIDGQMTELNPNGNISSCRDIMYEEFNLDSNYISLSKLSSENRGLVDNRPAERKKLINSIINVLDVYNGIYKNLSKKSSTYKSLISSLTYKIDYIGDESVVANQLASLEKRIGQLERDRNSAIEASAAIKVKITEMEQFLQDNNYNDISADLKETTKFLSRLKSQIDGKLSSYKINITQVEEYLHKINIDIAKVQSDIVSAKTMAPTLLNQREAEFKLMQDKQERLNSLQSEYNYIDIEQAMSNAQSIVDQYDSTFINIGLTHDKLPTKDEYDSAMESIGFLIEQARVLSVQYDRENIKYVVDNYTNMQNIKITLDQYISDEASLSDRISALEKEIIVYKSKREVAAELNRRPKKCKIDDCPYIESAIKANLEYPEETYIQMNNQLEDQVKELQLLRGLINEYNNYMEIYNILQLIVKELNSRIRFIKKFPVRADFQESFLDRIANGDPFNDLAELYKYIDYSNILEEYKLAIQQLDKYKSEYEVYESKNKILNELINDISELDTKVNNLAKRINENEKCIREQTMLEDNLNNRRDQLSALLIKINEEFKPSLAKQQELEKLKQDLDNNTAELSTFRSNLEIANHNIGEIESDIKNLSNERDTLKHSLNLLADYKAELVMYNDKYAKIEKIRHYSSPTSGIQTLFMQIYMNKIISTANELLSLLFDGEFMLQPFIINENEFRIPCLGSGLIHDDISNMSTAQKCMISMILSFALLHQSSTKYNILFLDEIDGGLDTGNRGYFIELLDRLMNMLRCEQCFIISHNSELSTSMADLIILKTDPNEVYNGNIIWQY